MTEGKEVEKRESQVPALAETPATEIGAEDIALPRLYIGQYMSDHVKSKAVEVGDLFTATGGDDPDPQVLIKQGSDEKLRVHILALRKGKSISEGGELVLFDFNDPDAPPEAWTTYNYAIALPDVDEEVPYKWLLTRTGNPTAKRMNMVIKKNEAKGPAYELAFDVSTAYRSNAKGEFYIPQASQVEANADHVKVAENLYDLVSGGNSPEVQATGNEPSL
jgi:hypothetical protein